jgi:SAM-dependent methyltransferase
MRSAPEGIACPYCHMALTTSDTTLQCSACGAQFPQRDPAVLQLMPSQFAGSRADWVDRQDQMTRWYDELRADPERAAASLCGELEPLAPTLAALRGPVIDLGGGLGLPRMHLVPGVSYVALEPDTRWADAAWSALVPALRGLPLPPPTVRGVGEYIPFRDGYFHGGLALWSLNHVDDPAQTLAELARVLAPGADLVLVLDEVEPRWRDLTDPAFPVRARGRAGYARRKLAAWRHGRWPVSEDHLAITERDLSSWCRGHFTTKRRWWCEANLVLELLRVTD